MTTQQNQKELKSTQLTIGNLWFWLGIVLLLFAAALVINAVNRTEVTVPGTGSSAQPQTVPEAAVQGVADYIRGHSDLAAQAVPDASVQSVANYLRAHSANLPTTTVTDPAAQSVMDYLKAHGIKQSGDSTG